MYDDPQVVSDRELAAVLAKVRPKFPPKERRPNFVEHALRTWGVDATFSDPDVMSGIEMPLRALRSQVASAIDIVVQVGRMPDGSRKLLAVAEVLGIDDTGRYAVNEIYKYEMTGKSPEGDVEGALRRTGAAPSFWPEVRLKGLTGLSRLTRDLFVQSSAADD